MPPTSDHIRRYYIERVRRVDPQRPPLPIRQLVAIQRARQREEDAIDIKYQRWIFKEIGIPCAAQRHVDRRRHHHIFVRVNGQLLMRQAIRRIAGEVIGVQAAKAKPNDAQRRGEQQQQGCRQPVNAPHAPRLSLWAR